MHLSCVLGVFAIYLLATLVSLVRALFFKQGLGRLVFGILIVGFLLHTTLLFYYLGTNQYPYFINRSYGLLFISWFLILLFFILSKKLKFEAVSPYLLPIALVTYLLSVIGREAELSGAGPQSVWVVVHFVSILLALSLFILGFGVGLTFIIQEGRLKAKKPLLARFPSLEVLDQVRTRTLWLGWVLLTIGIFSGMLLSWIYYQTLLFYDPRQIGALAAWAFYLIYLAARSKRGWRGRHGVLLPLLGLLVIFLTVLAARHNFLT